MCVIFFNIRRISLLCNCLYRLRLFSSLQEISYFFGLHAHAHMKKTFHRLAKIAAANSIKFAAEIPVHYIFIAVCLECDFVEVKYDIVVTLCGQGYLSGIREGPGTAGTR